MYRGLVFQNYPPLFAPRLWNVHDAKMNDEVRTNNSIWGCFSKLVHQNHPTVWTMISKIRLEISTDEAKLALE